jgi:hypothetical protein
MAHDLNYNTATQSYSFFSVKEKAWHGLGKIVEQYPTSAEAIKFAGLVYIMEIVTTLFRAKLTQGLADFWVAANAIKACTKIVI